MVVYHVEMTVYSSEFTEEIARILNAGGVGVIRTDTIYGIVAKASNETAVNRVFSIKRRTPTKPPISLISSTDQLFDEYNQTELDRLNELWPGKNTIILPAQRAPEWLMRGTNSVSYRLPDNPELLGLIEKTGPLIAPSANPEGEEPAFTIDMAKEYFTDEVDFYVDGGRVEDNTPSRLLRMLADGQMERLR